MSGYVFIQYSYYNCSTYIRKIKQVDIRTFPSNECLYIFLNSNLSALCIF